MRLVLAAVGRMKTGPERELLDRYAARVRAMVRAAGITAFDIIEVEEGRGRSADERRRDEATGLRERLPPGAFVVVFDERGESLTSARFAAAVARERDAGRSAFVFAIGGPDGCDDPLRSEAELVLAFGAGTLPHQLVRVLVAEQIYRALTIMTGHPYHRG